MSRKTKIAVISSIVVAIILIATAVPTVLYVTGIIDFAEKAESKGGKYLMAYQTRIIRTRFKAANFRSYCVKCLDNMSNITCGICLVSA